MEFKKSKYQDLIWFIDNAEDRIVVECDAEWYEDKFTSDVVNDEGITVANVPNGQLLNDLGLPPNWFQSKIEYTGETYIVTIERMWL